MRKDVILTYLIVVGLICGVFVGQYLYDPSYNSSDINSVHKHQFILDIFEFFGSSLFMSLLKMMIIPLIVSSLIYGVSHVNDFGSLGRIGAKTLIYYFSTMLIAVTVGLILVNMIRPGVGTIRQEHIEQARHRAEMSGMSSDSSDNVSGNVSHKTSHPRSLAGVMLHLVTEMIPTNIISAAAEGRPLPVIFFSLFFGISMILAGDKGRLVGEFFSSVYEVIIRMVSVILWLAPLAVFCLVAWTIARIGLGIFVSAMAKYMLTVILGLVVHGLIVLPVILWVFGRTNPYRYMVQMKQALITAFATDSSSATLPVTMRCAEESGGVSRKASGFVLPIGATINMDGTALYEAVAVIFLAQVFGVKLGMMQWVIVALTATLAAIGAAGIPHAGWVTMIIVISAVNNSVIAMNPNMRVIPEYSIFIILGVDRFLDMCRTTVNVWGDAVGAKIITKLEG